MINDPSVMFGNILGSSLIKSIAYSIASKRCTPYAELKRETNLVVSFIRIRSLRAIYDWKIV